MDTGRGGVTRVGDLQQRAVQVCIHSCFALGFCLTLTGFLCTAERCGSLPASGIYAALGACMALAATVALWAISQTASRFVYGVLMAFVTATGVTGLAIMAGRFGSPAFLFAALIVAAAAGVAIGYVLRNRNPSEK